MADKKIIPVRIPTLGKGLQEVRIVALFKDVGDSVEKDETLFRSAVCSEYETIAMMDFASFAIVETRMENFSCQVEGEAEGQVSVRCQGNLQASFGDETRSFDLSSRVYQVIEENGQWLVCGHLDEM